jgi:hypothetical protein
MVPLRDGVGAVPIRRADRGQWFVVDGEEKVRAQGGLGRCCLPKKKAAAYVISSL